VIRNSFLKKYRQSTPLHAAPDTTSTELPSIVYDGQEHRLERPCSSVPARRYKGAWRHISPRVGRPLSTLLSHRYERWPEHFSLTCFSCVFVVVVHSRAYHEQSRGVCQGFEQAISIQVVQRRRRGLSLCEANIYSQSQCCPVFLCLYYSHLHQHRHERRSRRRYSFV
jgi:hypothetical protein